MDYYGLGELVIDSQTFKQGHSIFLIEGSATSFKKTAGPISP
jgi:hypothetical protein